MKKKGISIIMPVYNAGAFLEESLKSILGQTFTDYELICVNDASDDMSAEILQKYADLDDRISIFTNSERQGAGESRNLGMEKAGGVYLSFLDADDIFESDMLEQAYNTIEEHQADILMYEYKLVPTKNIYEKRKCTHTEEYREKYCKNPFCMKDYSPYDFMKWESHPVTKLYRHAFIKEKDLKFQSLKNCNDVYFVDMALLTASKLIALDEERVMLYARDHDLPTRISYDRDPMCAYLALEKIQKELIERGLFGEVYEYFYYRVLFKLCHAIKKTKSPERAREFYTFLAKEGIRELRKRGGIYYEQNDGYIRNELKKFEDNSFDSRWYVSMKGRLEIHLKRENCVKEYENVISILKNERKKIIYGAGLKASEFIGHSVEKLENIMGVAVTSKHNDLADEICGLPVRQIDDYLPYAKEALVMIATIPKYQEEIEQHLKDLGFAHVLKLDMKKIEFAEELRSE